MCFQLPSIPKKLLSLKFYWTLLVVFHNLGQKNCSHLVCYAAQYFKFISYALFSMSLCYTLLAMVILSILVSVDLSGTTVTDSSPSEIDRL